MATEEQQSVICYGELGVERRQPHLINRKHLLDDEYDVENPPGSDCGRRNYRTSVYQSGRPDLEPGEYGGVNADFYREYAAKREPDGDIVAEMPP